MKIRETEMDRRFEKKQGCSWNEYIVRQMKMGDTYKTAWKKLQYCMDEIWKEMQSEKRAFRFEYTCMNIEATENDIPKDWVTK